MLATLVFTLLGITAVYLLVLWFISRRVDGRTDWSVVAVWMLLYLGALLYPLVR